VLDEAGAVLQQSPMLYTNRIGLPIRLVITPGQTYDIQHADMMVEGICAWAMLLEDKAYDGNSIRSRLHQQGAFANIPARASRKGLVVFNPHLYKARNVIERFFNKLRYFPRIDTRYDKLGSAFPAMIKLAAIRLYLRACGSTA